jgi:hypothetical protein
MPLNSKQSKANDINAENLSVKDRYKHSSSDAQLFPYQITTTKRRKLLKSTNRSEQINAYSVPPGPSWRANSCAFDSVISIIFNAWKYRSIMISQSRFGLNTTLDSLLLLLSETDISHARDIFQQYLAHSYSVPEFQENFFVVRN